jgi:hypothetical protein
MTSDPTGLPPKPKVFVSHSSQDAWVAQQIASSVRRCGADFFIDKEKIQRGDRIDDEILLAAESSTELLVLLTPWAVERPYVMMELGLFCQTGKRIIGVVHGLNDHERSLLALGLFWGFGLTPAGPTGGRTDLDDAVVSKLPMVLRQTNLVPLSKIDSYFAELKARVKQWEQRHGKKGKS